MAMYFYCSYNMPGDVFLLLLGLESSFFTQNSIANAPFCLGSFMLKREKNRGQLDYFFLLEIMCFLFCFVFCYNRCMNFPPTMSFQESRSSSSFQSILPRMCTYGGRSAISLPRGSMRDLW